MMADVDNRTEDGSSANGTALAEPEESGLSLTALMHAGAGIPSPLMRDIFLRRQAIVGTRYQGGSDKLVEDLKAGSRVYFMAEPDNRFDKNAVMALDGQGRKLGYIPRYENDIIVALLKAGKSIYGIVPDGSADRGGSRGRIVPGLEKTPYSLWVDMYMREFRLPDEMAQIPRQGCQASYAVLDICLSDYDCNNDGNTNYDDNDYNDSKDDSNDNSCDDRNDNSCDVSNDDSIDNSSDDSNDNSCDDSIDNSSDNNYDDGKDDRIDKRDDPDGKPWIKSICAIKVINGEERGVFRRFISREKAEGTKEYREAISSFQRFVGFLPIVGHDISERAVPAVEEAYGVQLGMPFSNHLIDTGKMAANHLPLIRDASLENLARELGIEVNCDSLEETRCRMTWQLYCRMERSELKKSDA